jgi:hypothetical protein
MSQFCCIERPCPCAPHPDIIAHLTESRYYAQFNEQEILADDIDRGHLSSPTGVVPVSTMVKYFPQSTALQTRLSQSLDGVLQRDLLFVEPYGIY